MSEIPAGLRYTKEHEWLKVEGGIGTVGITDHAQEELTDIVYVELPKLGAKVKKGDRLGAVESVKTVSDIYSPVTGEVVQVNSELDDAPGRINQEPYGQGWLAKLKLADATEANQLLDAATYKKLIEA
ncbi:MAG TPA: glycine cleavage system protein GcvH [Methanomassiliicoccales archaeon]|jgi:glycine cleavage system H protein|nr:glycine cleavage system protein GcvH [Methanomassiliicoccales archaeon]